MTKKHSILFMHDTKEQNAFLDLMVNGIRTCKCGNTVNGFSLDGAATH